MGWFIDRCFDSHPLGLLIGAILGLIGGMYNLIRQAIRMSRESELQRTERDKRD